jgi:hypothetical protein
MKRVLMAILAGALVMSPAMAQSTPPQPVESTPLTIGETVEATAEDNFPTYSFSAEAEDVIAFDLISDNFDPFLEIQDADGDVLASDDDSGDGFYARVLFVAPEAGEYVLVVKASFGNNADGGYTLLSNGDLNQLVFGEPTVVEVPQEGSVQVLFVGEEGQTVTIAATAEEDGVDTRLELADVTGNNIDSNDDFSGLNPSLYRVILPLSGLYVVSVSPVGSDDAGSVSVVLTEDELPLLSAEAITITLDDDQNREIVGFEAVSGTTYLLTVTASETASASLDLRSLNDPFAYTYLSFNGFEGASAIYKAGADGIVRVDLRNNTFSNQIDFTLSVTVQE